MTDVSPGCHWGGRKVCRLRMPACGDRDRMRRVRARGRRGGCDERLGDPRRAHSGTGKRPGCCEEVVVCGDTHIAYEQGRIDARSLGQFERRTGDQRVEDPPQVDQDDAVVMPKDAEADRCGEIARKLFGVCRYAADW